ncbi:MAG: AAA family ATPase [Bacteroidales bacterium]|nr:AAA family ATPase [Bacteroidales bacterium]
MERKITSKLLEWKTGDNRKPLILRGARQVGKSYSIIDFGENHFQGSVHEINLEKHPDWHSVFDTNLDAKRIISDFEILLNIRIDIGNDLLFFDEIQSCPKAIASLRYFYEQIPELHVISAGSLLEFALEDIPFPVGRVQLLNMYPMSFVEYLEANGKYKAAELITAPPVKFSESIHNMLNNELRRYFFVGGMPECVKTYSITKNMKNIFDIQADLVHAYRQDFSKYAPYSDKRCLNSVLTSCSKKVGQQIKYSRLAEDFSNPTIKKAYNLLCTAQLIRKVSAASPAGVPLSATASELKFKTIMLDIGLMTYLSGLSLQTEYKKSDLLAVYKGALAEQFVGQEFIAAGQKELYYWSRNAKSSNAEVDYLLVKQNKIIPIEVKSGVSGSLKSLHLLLNTYKNCEDAYIFSDAQPDKIQEQKLMFLPLYYAYSSTTQNITI